MGPQFLIMAIIIVTYLVFAPWTGHPFDMMIWFKTGQLLMNGRNIYEPLHHYGYPPLWAYWAGLSYQIYVISGENMPLWRTLIKLPQMLSLMILATLLNRMIVERRSKGSVSTWLQIPFWIYASYVTSVWGQLNALSALLLLIAFYLLEKDQVLRSATSLGTGIAVKLYPAITLPFFLAKAAKRFGRFAWSNYLILSAGVTGGVTTATFVFLAWDPAPFFGTLFYQPFSILCQACVGPRPLMNFWSLIWVYEPTWVSSWPAQILWLVVWLFIAFLWRKDLDVSMIVSLFLVFLALFPRVSEQSLVEFVPLLLLAYFSGYDSKVIKLGLAALPVVALAFAYLNFGAQQLTPLFSSETSVMVEAFYRTNERTMFTLMGLLGSFATIVEAMILVELSKRAHSHFSNLRTTIGSGGSIGH